MAHIHDLPIDYSRHDDASLIEHIHDLLIMEDLARLDRQQAEHELTRRMQERGATAIPHPYYECRLEYPTPSYDTGLLLTLKEILPPDVIKFGYTPAYEKTVSVPDSWDGRVLNSWKKKYGHDVAETIERAKLPANPKLRIKPRQEKS